MKTKALWLLAPLAFLLLAAVGTVYYETFPGLVIKHPVTGAVTGTWNGTNGVITGNGSGLTNLSQAAVTNAIGASGITAGMLSAGSGTNNIGYVPANKAGDTFDGRVTVPGLTSTANSTNNAQMYIDQLITPSVRLRRYVLTHAGTVTLDWSTNTCQKLVLTGNVTFAFSNLETNRTFDLIIANSQATNCNITWPAGCVFFGYQPTYISAYKHGWFQGQVGPQTNTLVHSAYSEQQ